MVKLQVLTCLIWNHTLAFADCYEGTLFESENERQKIEPVQIPLSRASRNFPDVKTRNDFFFIIGLWR